jgi:hypothetical protein
MLYTRGADGYTVEGDAITHQAYGKIPDASEFWHNYGYEVPETVHGWEWSTTFNKWSALVTFSDGWHGYTYPRIALPVEQSTGWCHVCGAEPLPNGATLCSRHETTA